MGRCRIGEEEKEGEKERGCGWDRGGRRRLEAASRVRELGGRLGDGGRRWTLCQAEQGGMDGGFGSRSKLQKTSRDIPGAHSKTLAVRSHRFVFSSSCPGHYGLLHNKSLL